MKNFKETKFLYGVPPSYFKGMEFFEAIKERMELAKKRLREEFDKLQIERNYYQYAKRLDNINAIKKAIEFNEFLWKELKEDK